MVLGAILEEAGEGVRVLHVGPTSLLVEHLGQQARFENLPAIAADSIGNLRVVGDALP